MAPLFWPARYKACHGGRGSTKSHSFAGALVLRHYTSSTRSIALREVQKSINASSKQVIVDKIKLIDPRNRFFRVLDTEIRDANGGIIRFSGVRTNPDSIKSMEGLDVAWFDEADKASQSSLDLLTPTLRAPGSELWFSWNRNRATDPVDNMFLGPGGPPPDSLVWEAHWSQNPWFPQPLYDEMMWMKFRDRDKWLWIWEGHLRKQSEALVFKNWITEDFTEEDMPSDGQVRLGADWGFAIDPSVLVRMVVSPSLRKIFFTHEAWALNCQIEKLPALFNQVPDARRRTIRADSSRPETIDYMRGQGFTIMPAKKGAGSIEDGIEWLKNYDVVIHPRCVHVIDEWSTYSYKVDTITGLVTSQLEDKKNHTVDATRYAVEEDRHQERRSSRPGVGIIF